MDAQCDELAGGSKRSKRSTAGGSTQSVNSRAEGKPTKSSKGGKSKKSKTPVSGHLPTDTRSEPPKKSKLDQNPSNFSGTGGETSGRSGKGQGKSKGKQRGRPRKSDTNSGENSREKEAKKDREPSVEATVQQEASSSQSKRKGKKRKSDTPDRSESATSNHKVSKGKGKSTAKKESQNNTKAHKPSKTKKSLPNLEFDPLDLYSDLETDFVEFEDLLSNTNKPPTPKKRCLRSASTEEKESSLVNFAGPSGSLSVGSSTSQSKKESGSSKKTKSKSEKTNKKAKSSKGDKTSTKGGTSARKTGSCASSSRGQSSGGRGRSGGSRASRETGKSSSSSSSNPPVAVETVAVSMSSSSDNPPPAGSQDGQSGATDGGSGAGPPQPQAEDPPAASSMPPGAVGGTDTDSDESEMNRLQALLEARGLPSHLFGALGPRMHQILHRTMSGGTISKVQHLLQGLQSTGDETQQLSALMDMCQILVMGNEDSLVGFPIKQVVPALIQLLQMEHNFEIMIHASRALTYMMEALPRSTAQVVEGVSVFLEKLQVISCIDVAEQSLSALETLSKRHGKAILHAGGISACLLYLDFFSIIAQRRALAITANCVQSMSGDEFHYMRDSLPLLSGKLINSDNKSCESVCLCFARLVDNFHTDQRLLKEIAVHNLLTNIQQLLVMSPPVISTSIFVTVVRMLYVMCSNCPDLAVILLKQKIAETLRYLLTGSSESTDVCFELVSRQPMEFYELVSLIGELLPRLPTDGLFSVNALLHRGGFQSLSSGAATCWQWMDDHGRYHKYSAGDNKILEAAYQSGEEEVSLTLLNRSYLVEFSAMQQINEDTGTTRQVRQVNLAAAGGANTPHSGPTDPSVERCDSRAEILKEDQELASSFIQTLFAVLYEVYSSSAGPNIRHKCLQTILRLIYYSDSNLLKEVLGKQSISSQLACMLASPDLKVVVGAVQMANIVMQKLPDVFSVYFRREGVMHQIQKLASDDSAMPGSPTKPSAPPAPTSTSSTPVLSSALEAATYSCQRVSLPLPRIDLVEPPAEGAPSPAAVPSGLEEPAAVSGTSPQLEEPCASSGHMKLSDVLKRKRPPRKNPSKKGNKSEESSSAEPPARGMGSILSRSGRGKCATKNIFTGKDVRSSSSGSKIPFLGTLNPAKWGRTERTERQATMKEMLAPKPTTPPVVVNKEKVRAWIKEQCKLFMSQYFSADIEEDSHPSLDTLKRLQAATKSLSLQGDSGIDCLLEITTIMRENDISPFEVIHSGLITGLLEYLTVSQADVPRDVRIRRFLHVFLGCPSPSVTYMSEPPSDKHKTEHLSLLVAKLMACLHQLEQFQVKVHDLPGGGGGSTRGGNALKFFTTHQLKCQLQRHADCTTLKKWKGGPVKIDPLALVQAIEKYLLVRGYGKAREGIEEDLSDDDNSDEEMEEQMASIVISASSPRHRLEFIIGGHVLPYNMTVYQAVRQFICQAGSEPGDVSDNDTDTPFGSPSLWTQTHTIYYRPATEQEENTATSPKKTKAESKSSKVSKKKGNKDVRAPSPVSQPILQNFLTEKLPSVTVSDASIDTIALLRVLSALNRHWSSMYDVSFLPSEILPSTEFLSSKLTAKANRQLQDPLIIMTGNLPHWLPDIGQAAPFLFPFETRQMLFFATTFDRDRAVLRLQQDQHGESAPHDNERVGPRLDRKRKEVSRKDILKTAEKVMDEMCGSGSARTLLEIKYDDEVGTGLGPTLEFYALVSKELQRSDLELWRGDKVTATSPVDPNVKVEYTSSPCGLFPSPLHRGSKASHVNKVKAKFKFLGKFMAKALMDSRMIDLPLSRVFYKWMLGMETSFTSSDLFSVDRVLARSFQQMEAIVHKKKQICADTSLGDEARAEALSNLTMDGCSLEELELYFVLPGKENIELCKGGKDLQVTIDNLDQYLSSVLHYTMVEGISRQFDSFREGFESLFPLSTLHCFFPEELEQLFCGNSSEVWDMRILTDCCRPDHGYNHDSTAVKYLFQVLTSYNIEEQRDFLQFVTGSPRLPVGGFRSLNPPLTIVRKSPEGDMEPDAYLPSVMTCVNYLKLPDYSSEEVMRERLGKAAKEGQLSFHLS